ncbi:MAG TPA: hypothetical protein VL197_10945 [Nitrospirota bacterium]|nr:hypothetical protein [Nitrospirota bacterium]
MKPKRTLSNLLYVQGSLRTPIREGQALRPDNPLIAAIMVVLHGRRNATIKDLTIRISRFAHEIAEAVIVGPDHVLQRETELTHKPLHRKRKLGRLVFV